MPQTLVNDLGRYTADIQTQDSIEVSIVPTARLREQGIIDQGVAIEPNYYWILLSIVGKAVFDLAAGIISNAIYDKLAEKQEGRGFVVTIRSQSGMHMTIESDQPLDFDQLEEFLKESIFQAD